jgi:hypothetical protein
MKIAGHATDTETCFCSIWDQGQITNQSQMTINVSKKFKMGSSAVLFIDLMGQFFTLE